MSMARKTAQTHDDEKADLIDGIVERFAALLNPKPRSHEAFALKALAGDLEPMDTGGLVNLIDLLDRTDLFDIDGDTVTRKDEHD
jgi:hypothetical protein